MKSAVFWAVTSYSLVDSYQISCIIFQKSMFSTSVRAQENMRFLHAFRSRYLNVTFAQYRQEVLTNTYIK
jgi:hypothetical protein